jgi:DNA-binding NarL/FixJ family response regulator
MPEQVIVYEHFDSAINPIKVAIADDHNMLRTYIAESINVMQGFRVVLSVENGKLLLQGIQSLNDLPDICIIDISMPEMNGYDTQAAIKRKWPEIKSLAISIYDDEDSIVRMLQNGANGFISKQSGPEMIREALTAVFCNGYYYKQIPDNVLKAVKMLPQLTDKEKEYTLAICAGLSNEAIAQKMNLTVNSLQYYRDAIYRKLNINNRADLICYAKRTGIVFTG